MTQAIMSSRGALFIQPSGPNTETFFLGCFDMGDLSIPEGAIELVRCFNTDGATWRIVGEKKSPPDKVTTSLATLSFLARSYVEDLTCPFTLYALQSDCGDVNVFSNWKTGYVLSHMRRTNTTISNLAKREEDVEITKAFDLEGWTATPVDELEGALLTTTLVTDINDIWMNRTERCYGDCGATISKGEWGLIGNDGTTAAKPIVDYTADFGATFTAAAALPASFTIDDDIMSVTAFYVGRTTIRRVVARMGGAAGQGAIAYSDDNFATWTSVTIGGAAAGHGPTRGHGMFSLDQSNIWMAGAAGYIYKSTDGCVTWTARESGTLTAGNYSQCHFSDTTYGMAVAAAGIVSLTDDGGLSWTAGGLIAAGAAGNMCCHRIDRNKMWVGDDAGKFWYSEVGGTTWTQRTGWVGSGVGTVQSLDFYGDQVGMMVSNDGTPDGSILMTIDGGYSWDVITTPSNDGLNIGVLVSPYLGYVVGEDQAGTGIVVKVSRSYTVGS